jgi:hypothetical protein
MKETEKTKQALHAGTGSKGWEVGLISSAFSCTPAQAPKAGRFVSLVVHLAACRHRLQRLGGMSH